MARKLLALVAVGALTGSFTVAWISPAHAVGTTRYVATTGDDTENDCTDASNPCRTIVHAVEDMAAPGDTVSIAPGLYAESVTVLNPVTIVGAGPEPTTISGDSGSGAPSITVDGSVSGTQIAVTLSNLEISGNASNDGLDVVAANVTIADSRASNNDADGVDVRGDSTLGVSDSSVDGNSGQGIVSDLAVRPTVVQPAAVPEGSPQVSVTGSDVSNNAAGGVDAIAGTVDITGSSISHNQNGGVLANPQGAVTIDRSSLTGNALGGVALVGATAHVTRSTISGTTPSSSEEPYGGGVLVLSSDGFGTASLTLSESTLANNTNVGVLALNGGDIEVDHSTITGTHPSAAPSSYSGGLAVASTSTTLAATADPAPGFTATATIDAANDVPNCSGIVTNGGYNLESDGSCQWGSYAPAPQLGALADNGGPTLTVLPGFSSPARNAIPLGAAGCLVGATDQRGLPRPDAVTHRCDIGAVEAQVVNPKLTASVAATHGRHHGWYRGVVSVRFHCTRGSAPLTASCPAAVHTTKSGKHHVTRTIHAFDGGRASVSKRFKVDNTKPRIRVFLKHGKAHVKCRDRLSGVASCHVRSRHVGSKLKFVAKARDKAGNVRHKRGKLALG